MATPAHEPEGCRAVFRETNEQKHMAVAVKTVLVDPILVDR